MKKIVLTIIVVLLLTGVSSAGPDFSSILEAARQGDADAMCDTGLAYFNGEGTLKDPFKAKCWVEKAYQQGSGRAKKIWEELKLWEYSGKCDLSFDNTPGPKYSKGTVYIEPVTRMRFVYIPKGCFKMGCHSRAGKCSKPEKPVHTVCVDGFWMGAYEVDQGLWQTVMGSNPSRFNSRPDHPVENVSFEQVERFIHELNAITGQRFSLPTDAQWEYACRNGGKSVPYPWDEDEDRPDANCGSCSNTGLRGQTAPVGSFYPNDIGLYDMGGNVKEWCKDVYDKKAYAGHRKNNPEYKKRGSSRVVRGGSFSDNADMLRCTARDDSIPTMQADNIGFRLVLIQD